MIKKSKILMLMLVISRSVLAQPASQQAIEKFNAIAKVEDKEKYYNQLVSKNTSDQTMAENLGYYRGQLALEWLYEGDLNKYKLYKSTHPKFTDLQLFDISNKLEDWVDDDKNIAFVEQASKELLNDLDKKMYTDRFARQSTLMEVNAMANARLGNIDAALKSIESPTVKSSPFRDIPYFRNSMANYLTRYGLILYLSGQHQRAFDTLSNAIRQGASTAKTANALQLVYKKVKGDDGADKYVASLQEEAYHKVYQEIEKEWKRDAKSVPGVVLKDINGQNRKITDYKGKIVIVDFWSTACKPCVAAFPAFERAVDLYKGQPFQLFVINEGEDQSIVKPYMDKKGYTLEVLFDNNEAFFKSLEAIGTPQKFVIDAKGNIRLIGIGYAGSDDKEFYKLKAMVEITKLKS